MIGWFLSRNHVCVVNCKNTSVSPRTRH
jgi:hypothetical protein